MSIKKITPFPLLETERLALRVLSPDDASDVFDLRSNEENQAYIDRPLAKNIQEASDHIDMIVDGIHNQKWINWAITIKGVNKVIGLTGFWNYHETKPQVEIGYELHPHYQGKGYMTEATKAILEYGFREMGIRRVQANIHKENAKSIALLKKFGFMHDVSWIDEDEPEMILWWVDDEHLVL